MDQITELIKTIHEKNETPFLSMLLYKHIALKNPIMFNKTGELRTYKGYPGKV